MPPQRKGGTQTVIHRTISFPSKLLYEEWKNLNSRVTSSTIQLISISKYQNTMAWRKKRSTERGAKYPGQHLHLLHIKHKERKLQAATHLLLSHRHFSRWFDTDNGRHASRDLPKLSRTNWYIALCTISSVKLSRIFVKGRTPTTNQKNTGTYLVYTLPISFLDFQAFSYGRF